MNLGKLFARLQQWFIRDDTWKNKYEEKTVEDMLRNFTFPKVKQVYPTLISSQIVGMTPADIADMGKRNIISKEAKNNVDKIIEVLNNGPS